MNDLFGTDGVRGRANALLTPELAIRLARAAASALPKRKGRVIIGRDTRTSGPMLESALAAGFASAGREVLLAGIIPTPAISFLIKDQHADLGAVVSASHNPPDDNGIKLFDARGLKLTVEEEASIEQAMIHEIKPSPTIGSIQSLEAAAASYAAFLAGTIDVEAIDLSSHKIVVDCAYGATYKIAPHVLRHLGATVIDLHCEADGTRINQACGSTHLDAVRAAVAEHEADLGIAFDGDGDRVMLVAGAGAMIDGDQMMGIVALHLQRRGLLSPPTVIATVMSNLGFERTLEEHGIRLIRTPVGDRNVSEALREHEAQLGGEQSGHIIFSDHASTGDGILTAVKLLEIAHAEGESIERLAAHIRLFPQVHLDIPCKKPQRIAESPAVAAAILEAKETLGKDGRLIARPSGTQPVFRLTVEAEDELLARKISKQVESVIAEAA